MVFVNYPAAISQCVSIVHLPGVIIFSGCIRAILTHSFEQCASPRYKKPSSDKYGHPRFIDSDRVLEDDEVMVTVGAGDRLPQRKKHMLGSKSSSIGLSIKNKIASLNSFPISNHSNDGRGSYKSLDIEAGTEKKSSREKGVATDKSLSVSLLSDEGLHHDGCN